ncbi:DUF169 domain-containing protein [Halosquirtibacter xylanolyticus]|uniref:DUF169 domain-containing protein n=1 Tax=Halosquirtibacter xylanolyticus TaxID=3374599 RepID=UPI003748E2D6|nr:DUF169 domain-containing protein [Prolixibacteraceae bacterium]
MNKETFIENYRTAFGNYELPIVFWYSKEPAVQCRKSKGCYLKDLDECRQGGLLSYGLDDISCPGGKVYAGFSEEPPFLSGFVSGKEKFKSRPELVTRFIDELNLPNLSTKYLNFAPLSYIEDLKMVEGLVFFATPDVLSGLVYWAQFDSNNNDAVSVPFGSGCSSLLSQTLVENSLGGKRTFIGLFDPAARSHFNENILTFAIPMSRFEELYHTFDQCCLQGTHAWQKIKDRIDG